MPTAAAGYGFYIRVCLLHDASITDAVRIITLSIEIFHDES